MKRYFILMLVLILFSCKEKSTKETEVSFDEIKIAINTNIDSWHQAAANADFDAYFDLMTEDGVFFRNRCDRKLAK